MFLSHLFSFRCVSSLAYPVTRPQKERSLQLLLSVLLEDTVGYPSFHGSGHCRETKYPVIGSCYNRAAILCIVSIQIRNSFLECLYKYTGRAIALPLAVAATFGVGISKMLKFKDRTSLPGDMVPSSSIHYLYRKRCENVSTNLWTRITICNNFIG